MIPRFRTVRIVFTFFNPLFRTVRILFTFHSSVQNRADMIRKSEEKRKEAVKQQETLLNSKQVPNNSWKPYSIQNGHLYAGNLTQFIKTGQFHAGNPTQFKTGT